LFSPDLASLLLPIKHSHRVLNLLLLLTSFSHFAFEFLLCIKLPELGIDLLFKHLLLDGASLINKLLLPLDRSSVVVELGVLLAQSVVRALEEHVLTAGHLVVPFLLALCLQGLQALEHLLTDLLRRFQIVVEFLFVNAVLSGKKLGKASLPLLKVGCLSSTHVLDAVANNVLLDQLARLPLPIGLVSQVLVSFDVVHHVLVFLKQATQVRVRTRKLHGGEPQEMRSAHSPPKEVSTALSLLARRYSQS